jgi:hypothetical protein
MTVLRDVSYTLKELIQKNVAELSHSENSIVFESPADIVPSGSTMLSIFLYQILQNGFLRNIEPKPIDTTRMKYPPLNLDLYYMFTPYAKDIDTELIIMEELMKIFHDFSVLRGSMLQGELLDSGNDEIRIVPNNVTFDEINKLWERFPNKSYKLSASYILSPVSIPSGKDPAKITRVITKDLNLYRKETDK